MSRLKMFGCGCVAVAVVAMAASSLLAAPRETATPSGAQAASVDLFDGMRQGQIEVKVIPKNSEVANILVTNKTDKPLHIKLPDAFVASPVLAQAGLGIGGNGGGMGGGGGSQSTGGGAGGGDIGGGVLNIAPEQVGRVKLTTVCLEHGKDEPRAAIPYEIKPVESFTSKEPVRELLAMLGRGEVNQRVAQAAAWHLQNDMSWEELAGKQYHHANGLNQPYFSRAEIQAAMRISNKAEKLAEEKKAKGDSQRTDSLAPMPSQS